MKLATSVSINSFKADPKGRIGSVLMFCFAIFSVYRWYSTGFLFFALLTLRELMAACFLLTRNPDQSQGGKKNFATNFVAYLSSAMPLLYFSSATSSPILYKASSVLVILGFTLSTLALLELGKSFGVSPAHRGQVRTGIYRFLNHPMYLGYMIAETGMLIINLQNIFFWLFSCYLYFIRQKMENIKIGNTTAPAGW